MIAEAENEVNHGPNDLAYECINAVRERAGIKKLAANLDEESFRKAIKDERAMELCFEYTRRFDLIRWGDYYKLMQEQVDKAQADESWKFGSLTTISRFLPMKLARTVLSKQIIRVGKSLINFKKKRI